MGQAKPDTMQAIAIDQFGGVDTLKLQSVPVPELAANDVLIRLRWAGVGEWDPFEREGGYAKMMNMKPIFPYILGSEGSGTVAAVGSGVKDFKEGDEVYATGFLNPKGGFYAEYAAVDAGLVSFIPKTLNLQQAGVMSGVGVTALRGLEDTLKVKRGDCVLIFGAGGGVGHLAVGLALRMGARVFAVASGTDGVALAEWIGADRAVKGDDGDTVLAEIRKFAPDGLDAALLTAGGEVAQKALEGMRKGGRIAYPSGVAPEPKARTGIKVSSYNGEPDADIIKRLNKLIEQGGVEVHIAQTFSLVNAADAHRALDEHYLGKIALRVS